MSSMTSKTLADDLGWSQDQDESVIAELDAFVENHVRVQTQYLKTVQAQIENGDEPFASLKVKIVGHMVRTPKRVTMRELFYAYD